MTEAQYRCLVAYMMYWQDKWSDCSLDRAIREVGITESKERVIEQLFKAGYDYVEATGKLRYGDD